MSKKNLPRTVRYFSLLIALVLLTGCHTTTKTNRGYMVRGDWAMEFNRTPWVGCPPNSGCDDKRTCGGTGCDGGCADGCGQEKKSGFRRHCGLRPGCTTKRPCCRTLGCGMWIDTSDPNSFGGAGSPIKACGLTPFCSPMKPCGLTANCGRVINQGVMNANPLMLGNGGQPMLSTPGMNGGLYQNQLNGEIIQPTPVSPPRATPGTTPGSVPGMMPEPPENKPTTIATPNSLLLSKGIVPGVSMINGGGIVAAAGVATPGGIMTPSGVQLPNGMLHTGAVIKVCAGHQGCSPARPCGMTPGCGTAVPLAIVSNNAVMLASNLSQQGMAGGVIQAGGPTMMGGNAAGRIPVVRAPNGMLVHAVTGQPMTPEAVRTLMENRNRIGGGAELGGYPPIGYAQRGYSPNARYAELGWDMEEEPEAEADEEIQEAALPGARSRMPFPRFQSVPTKPVFQRSEGLPSYSDGQKKTMTTGKKTASNDRRFFSDENIAAAMEEAYLSGMSDAMFEVEEELDGRSSELANAQKKAELVDQAQKLEVKFQRQKALELQALELEEREEKQREIARIQAQRRVQLKAKEEALLRQQELLAARSQDGTVRQTRWNTDQDDDDGVRPARYRDSENGDGRSILASTGHSRNEKDRQDLTLSMKTPYRGASVRAGEEEKPAEARLPVRQVKTAPPTPIRMEHAAHTVSQPQPPSKKSSPSVKSWGAGLVENVGSSIGNSVKWIKGDGKRDTTVSSCGTCVQGCSCAARHSMPVQSADRNAAMQSRRLPKTEVDSFEEDTLLPGRPKTFQDEPKRDKTFVSRGADDDASPYFVQQAYYVDER